MIRVGIVGATGYTGRELLRLLYSHPEAELTALISSSGAGKTVASSFPGLLHLGMLTYEEYNPQMLLERCDALFMCLPHRASMTAVQELMAAGAREEEVKILDLSADFRLQDARTYERWYGAQHTAAELLSEAVYGLPELHRGELLSAQLIAVPGCYATSAILALAPLYDAMAQGKLRIESDPIVNSMSGVSGAGKQPTEVSHFPECDGNLRAYNLTKHRHTPEIEQELTRLTGGKPIVTVAFNPHLVPISRGILSTSMVKLGSDNSINRASLHERYEEFYADAPFVRVHPVGTLPEIKYVRGTNFCDIGVEYDPRTGYAIIVSVIDNLVKGASGQAIQCFNIACGLPEATGIDYLPFAP